MTNRNRLLYALVLLPTLLLTSCYKDFDKVRVKPFKPDLVVPLAMADNITFEDMLVKDLDPKTLKNFKDEHDRIGFSYGSFTYNQSHLRLSSPLNELSVSGGKVSKDELISGNSSNLEVLKIIFAKGARIKANRDVTLSLEDGSKLNLNDVDFCASLREGSTLVLPIDASNDCTLTFQDAKRSVDSVEVKIETYTPFGGNTDTVTLDAFNGLLWYSGELTDPQVTVKIEPHGWLARVGKFKYWFEGSSVKTKVDGREVKTPLVGRGGNDPLPFNEVGKQDFFAYWERGTTNEKPYNVNQINVGRFSKEWPLSYTLGKFQIDYKGEVVTLDTGKFGSVRADVALKLPITGRFNALVREFRPGNDSAVSLPDVNSLLQDSGRKGGIKSRFTKNDTVLLHFYFKNATPMDIYLAAKIGGNNKLPKGEAGQRASVIEGLNSGIDKQELRKDNELKIGDFEFFKAVGGADVDEKNKLLGFADTTKMKSKVVTIEIPYSEYKRARESIEGRQLRALLLFRSPNGDDGKPIVVSPRLDDYVSIRLGVEVKPEVSIELMNKE